MKVQQTVLQRRHDEASRVFSKITNPESVREMLRLRLCMTVFFDYPHRLAYSSSAVFLSLASSEYAPAVTKVVVAGRPAGSVTSV